jgi:hypothetical protein
MVTIGYLVLGYFVVGMLLEISILYFDQRLKGHIDIKYPEEGKVIRLYEWQWYPWSIGRRTLRALIKKQSSNDSELAQRAKREKLSIVCFLVWCVLTLLGFAVLLFTTCLLR